MLRSLTASRLWLPTLAALFFLALSAAFLSRGLSPDGLLSPPTLLGGVLLQPDVPGPAPPPSGVPTRESWAFDHVSYYAPYAAFIQRELREGRLPLWNPLIGTGVPVVEAMLPTLFHPFTLLLLVLPFNEALTVLVVIRLALAGLGAFLLVRVLAGGIPAATLAGVLFMLMPFHLNFRLHNVPSVSALLPFLLLISELRLRGGSARRCGAAWSLLGTLSILGGHPETTFHTWVAAWTYHLLRAATSGPAGRRWKSIGDAALFLALCGALAVLGASVPLWGCLEVLRDSALLRFRSAYDVPGPMWGLSSLLVPTRNYLGIVTLLLAARGVVGRGAFPAAPWVGLGLLALLAIYQPWPLGAIVDALPIVGVGLHNRAIFVVHLSIAVLAACGLGAPPSRGAMRAVLAAGLLIALTLGTLWARGEAPGPTGWCGFPLALAVPALALILGCVLLSIPARWQRGSGWALAMVVMVFTELYIAHAPTPHDHPARFPSLPAALGPTQVAPESGRVLVSHELLPANVNMVYGFASLALYEPTLGLRMAKLLRAAGMRNVLAITLLAPPEPGGRSLRLLNLLNVRYIVTRRPISVPELAANLELLASDPVSVYRNPHALPRAFVVEKAKVASGPGQALAWLRDPRIDLEDIVILEQPAPPVDVRAATAAPRSAEILEYRPGEVRVAASSPTGGYLVFSETYLPGWRASVDGSPARVLRGDYALVAVRLAPGRHEVVLRYRPRSLTLGGPISVTAILVALLASMIPASSRSPRRGSQRCA